jgi:Domain of unknown function (DUF4157)
MQDHEKLQDEVVPATREGARRDSPASDWALAGNRGMTELLGVPVQRLATDELSSIDGEAVADRIGAAESSGHELDSPVRERVADALGADPGPVRIHTDAEADDLSQTVGATAFTSGRDVFFRDGAFDPGSPEGFELLVHESTHVLQQAAGPVSGTATADGALAISDPHDAFEQAASANVAQLSESAPATDSRPVQRQDEDDDLTDE